MGFASCNMKKPVDASNIVLNIQTAQFLYPGIGDKERVSVSFGDGSQ